MKKLMTAVAAVALFAGIGMAGANAATRLTDSQLDHVTAGGGGFVFVFDGTTAQAGSGASAGWGFTSSHSVTNSVQVGYFDDSFAASSAHAGGAWVHAGSGASSSAGLTIAAGGGGGE